MTDKGCFLNTLTLIDISTSWLEKNLLTEEHERLDPVLLIAQLESLQDELWQYAWNKSGKVNQRILHLN